MTSPTLYGAVMLTDEQINAREIPLTRGLVALVDDADYEHLMIYRWHASYKGYAVATTTIEGKKVHLRMHRLILGLSSDDDRKVDHINGSRTDNRRSNLRICSASENNRNVGVKSNSRSGYKGVAWDEKKNRWRSAIRVNGKTKHLGYFHTADQAQEAFVKAATELHGDFFCERNLKRAADQTGVQP